MLRKHLLAFIINFYFFRNNLINMFNKFLPLDDNSGKDEVGEDTIA